MRVLVSLVLLATVACQPSVIGPGGGGGAPSTPANLTYELEPSGDPNRPLGILLLWDDVTDANLSGYRIYSRSSSRWSRSVSRCESVRLSHLLTLLDQRLVRPARRDQLEHIPRQRCAPSAVSRDGPERRRRGKRQQ